MNLVLVQGGQTGVDRGAWRAGAALDTRVTGYMPKGRRDEFGPIPDEIQADMTESHLGLAGRTKQNLELSSALVVVVQDRTDPHATPGTKLTLTDARGRGLTTWVFGPRSQMSAITIPDVAEQIRNKAAGRPPGVPFLLMVAGPRQSLWTSAEQVAYEHVHELVLAIRKEQS